MILAIRQLRVGVAQPRQERCARFNVQFVEQFVAAISLLELGNIAVRIVNVAKDYRSGGAGLLAGADDIAVLDRCAVEFGVPPGAVDPLQTVSALFHDPARANRDVRVLSHLDGVGQVLSEVEEVEPQLFEQ